MDTTDHSEKSELKQSDKELDDGLQLDSLFEETNINTSPTPVNNKTEEGKTNISPASINNKTEEGKTNISPASINNKTEEVKINIFPEAKNNKTKKGPCPSHVGNGNPENKKHGDTLANLHATLTRPCPSRTTRGREVRLSGYLMDYVV